MPQTEQYPDNIRAAEAIAAFLTTNANVLSPALIEAYAALHTYTLKGEYTQPWYTQALDATLKIDSSNKPPRYEQFHRPAFFTPDQFLRPRE